MKKTRKPSRNGKREKRQMIGSMKGQVVIHGDVIGPANDPDAWEVISNPDRVLDPTLGLKKTCVPRKRSK